jgi:hypothetical protein
MSPLMMGYWFTDRSIGLLMGLLVHILPVLLDESNSHAKKNKRSDFDSSIFHNQIRGLSVIILKNGPSLKN